MVVNMAKDFSEDGDETWTGKAVSRLDDFMNVLSRLGDPDRDRTSSTNNELRAESDFSEREAEIFYRDNHYAAKAVDLPADEATRKGFKVTVTGNEDTGSAFDEDFRRLNLVRKCNQADKWSRVYGGGGVVLGIDDGKDPSEPIDYEAMMRGEQIAERVAFAFTLDRFALFPETGQFQSDPKLPGFGKPSVYRIQFRDQASFQSAQAVQLNADVPLNERIGFGTKIHSSRLLRFYGVSLPTNLESDEDYWGDSILRRMREPITSLTSFERAIANISQTFVQSVFRMPGLRALLKKKDAADTLMSRFMAMTMSQSVLSMIVLDGDESYEKRTTSVSGLDALYDRIAQSYAAAADFPMTRAFGQTPGGLGTNDESSERNLENATRARQIEKYVPVLEYAARILAATAEGPDIPAGAELMVEPNPLREMTEEQAATVAKTWAEFAAILVDRSVVAPEEVRKSFFSGVGFTGDIQIDDEDEQQASELGDITNFDGSSGDILAMMSDRTSPLYNDDGEPIASLASLMTFVDAHDAQTEGTPEKYKGIDFTPPRGAKNAAKKVLKWNEEHPDEVDAMTATGWARARQLANGGPVSPEVVKAMAQFNRHRKNSKIAEEYEGEPWRDRGYVAWLGWGGDTGVNWALRKTEEMKRAEKKDSRPELVATLTNKLEAHNGKYGADPHREANELMLRKAYFRGGGELDEEQGIRAVNELLAVLRGEDPAEDFNCYDLLPKGHDRSTRVDAYASFEEVGPKVQSMAEAEEWSAEARAAFVETFNEIIRNQGAESKAFSVAIQQARITEPRLT